MNRDGEVRVPHMAIVKANYTRDPEAAKAHIRYIAHRPTREGGKITRILFGHDGPMEKLQAYRMIDDIERKMQERGKRNIRYYRVVFSPDPKREDAKRDLDLWEMTKKAMVRLEKRFKEVQFVAAEHN